LRGIERLTRVELARAEVPRDSATFTAELERSRTARATSGPPQGHGGRPAHGGGHGRSAGGGRGHGGRHAPARDGGGSGHGAAASASGGGGAQKPKLVGSWGGKRRR
jgi:ATP-dependent RNA helicase RhlE